MIKNQLTLVPDTIVGGGHGGTYPNLFDAHPPFQIDGNFGCTAGIAEMLVQSHDGFVNLLPALPDEWASGSVSGICCVGGFVIDDLRWEHGVVTYLRIRSTLGGNLRLSCSNQLTSKTHIESPVLGIIPPTQLSGGVKTLILINHVPDKVFNASNCGDNCAAWLLKIGSQKDVTVNLRHIMDFGDGEFEIKIQNNGKIVHNMKELLFEIGDYV